MEIKVTYTVEAINRPIVGSDDWTYTVEPPAPGERATLQAMYHLDDL